jgi:phosphoribosylformimino-5-aminoimidazole carboxamide ribotide isomerase
VKIIPAIDLQDGKCVRLFQGEFDKTTQYSADPTAIAREFTAMNVETLHIVDLDGARSGKPLNNTIVTAITQETTINVQLGGGIRHRNDVAHWLKLGVSRCVIGSVAIDDPQTVLAWIEEFGTQAMVLALDVRLIDNTPTLTTHGWTNATGTSLWDCLDRYYRSGCRQVLCTDVERDGAMTGPNFVLYRDIMGRYPELQLQASGGVRHIRDLEQLRELGVPAAITGRALLDGAISAQELSSFRQNG